MISGCTTVPLRQSFNNYSDVYAETQNRQMLLNLARLHEREPIYFFQLAQISASYSFSQTLGLSDLKSSGLPVSTTANIRTANGSLGESATHSPIFTLIPLAGDKFAQQMLAPIKPQVFYELFEEGWPLDLLMRVLIERIEIVMPAPDCTTILENNPWQGMESGASDATNVVRDGPKGYYDRFLRACALAREFQKHGLLYLAEEKSFKVEEPVSLKTPDAKNIENAVKDGLTWRKVGERGPGPGEDHGATADGVKPESARKPAETNGWQLAKESTKTFFRVASYPDEHNKTPLPATMTKRLMESLKGKPCYGGCDDPVTLFANVVMTGFDVTDDTAKGREQIAAPAANGPISKGEEEIVTSSAERRPASGQAASGRARVQVRLVMRSLMGAMTALASEQEGFDHFNKWFSAEQRTRCEIWKNQPEHKVSDNDNWAPLPESQMHPVLALIQPEKGGLGHPVVELDYLNHHFAIADRMPPAEGTPETWNRDVFRLLIQLSFLATADPTAFASPSLIQLH